MNFTKRILGIATAIVLCIPNICSVMQPLTVNAESYGEEQQYGDYLYYKTIDEDEDGTFDYVEITDCDESVVEIIIPSEIDGLPVTSIGDDVFSWCESLTSIEIPNSVTSIGDGVFSWCESLASIEISNSVTSIGDYAFFECESLESITIENPDCEISDSEYTISNGCDNNWNGYFNGTIYGYSGSTAQSYAGKYGYNFESLGEKPVVTVITGDANGDGELNVRDCAFIARLLSEGKKDELPKQADYNGDGEINVRDASMIARFLANKKS